MADTTNLKSFDLVCPDPECGEDFEIECDPATALTDDGDLIECPACFQEWEWEYDAEAGTLELVGDDFDDSGAEDTETEDPEEDD